MTVSKRAAKRWLKISGQFGRSELGPHVNFFVYEIKMRIQSSEFKGKCVSGEMTLRGEPKKWSIAEYRPDPGTVDIRENPIGIQALLMNEINKKF
jgi:hypothetical protein